jgi:hypothetical protein
MTKAEAIEAIKKLDELCSGGGRRDPTRGQGLCSRLRGAPGPIELIIDRCVNNRKSELPVVQPTHATTGKCGGVGEASTAGDGAFAGGQLAVGGGTNDRRGGQRRLAVA